MSLLRFITCGSVDDGKSTLIGRMLYDAKLLYADQKETLELDSKVKSQNEKIDYSLLLDGLIAEREQGITIDVAYRYFYTDKRSFIVADTPGHEEYTRNMAVGASYADLAVVLVDASKGILVQTKRHARICSLMGIKYYVFVVNKMDLVHYREEVYDKNAESIREIMEELSLENYVIVPVSATEGDNITAHSDKMPWYKGDTFLGYLEKIDVGSEEEHNGFVMPVQRVCRPHSGFRGFQGQVETGTLSVGDTIIALPSGEGSEVVALYNTDRKVDSIHKGQATTICLNKEIDVSRGCVFSKDHPLKVSNMFRASILWLDDTKLIEGKSYLLKIGTKLVVSTVIKIDHAVDINTGEHRECSTLNKNEIAACQIVTLEEIAFDTFDRCKGVGHFILIDRISNATAACGVVDHEVDRLSNLFWQKLDITREFRSQRMSQKPMTIWFTGLSGAGKTTLANGIEKKLVALGRYTMTLDGDNVRMGLNKDLGFSERERVENIRRVAEVSKLMNDAGLIVLTSFISPFISERQRAREIIGPDSFIEVYVATPVEECEKRDQKGLYKKARENKISDFTGVSSPYEAPEYPDIIIDTTNMTIEESIDHVFVQLQKHFI